MAESRSPMLSAPLPEGDAPLPQDAPRTRPLGNASYLTAATVGAKLFSFIFVFYATRALKPALFGNYTLVLSFVGLFGVLTDLGLGTLAVRDVTQDRTQGVRYVSNLLALRVLSSIVAVALIVGFAQVAIAPSLRSAVYLYGLALIPLAISNTLQLAFQFSERMAYSAVLNVVGSALTAGLSIAVLAAGHHVLALVTVFTLVAIANTAMTAWLVYKRFLPPRLSLDPHWWPELLRRAAPFVALTLLNVLYFRADTQILSILSGCRHASGCTPVGLYGIAYRPLDILIIIFAASINAATLPAFNRVVAASRQDLTRLVRSSGTLALAFGVPIALVVTSYSREALYILGGDKGYLVAAPALSVLVWAFPCFLIEGMIFNALYALHRQQIVTMAFGVTLIFNVATNLVLIPHYSYMASAALTVVSELVNLAIVLIALRRATDPLHLGPAVAKMAAIAVVVAVMLWGLRAILDGYSIFAGIPLSAIVVLLGFRLTRIFGVTEREILERMPVVGRYTRLF